MKRTQQNLRLVAKIESQIEDPEAECGFAVRVQKKPYTFVEIMYWADSEEDWIYGKGFSKVCHPDTFDSECGYRLAIRRAAQHIVEQLNGHDAEEESWTGPPMEPSDEELIARVPLM